jgi:hypothetical protein
MLKREKFIPPSRDEVFIWEFFVPARRDEVFIWEFFISLRRDPGICCRFTYICAMVILIRYHIMMEKYTCD